MKVIEALIAVDHLRLFRLASRRHVNPKVRPSTLMCRYLYQGVGVRTILRYVWLVSSSAIAGVSLLDAMHIRSGLFILPHQ